MFARRHTGAPLSDDRSDLQQDPQTLVDLPEGADLYDLTDVIDEPQMLFVLLDGSDLCES
ncbi:MAG: hypothetical protein SGPRY_014143 [Prymnesium sp.]